MGVFSTHNFVLLGKPKCEGSFFYVYLSQSVVGLNFFVAALGLKTLFPFFCFVYLKKRLRVFVNEEYLIR